MPEANHPHAIPEILQQHFDELVSLLAQRNDARFSPDYLVPDIVDLDHRIAAHLDGLLVDPTACLAILEPEIQGGEPAEVLAAAHVLLQLKSDAATDLVVGALLGAEAPEQLEPLGQALCCSPIDRLPLEMVLESASDGLASVILLAFAFHRKLDGGHPRLNESFSAESADVRARAWQTVALLGS